MKKYILSLALATTLLMGQTACTDLDPELYSNLTTANAYSSESDIEAALVGVYADINPYPGDAWMYYAGYLVMTTDYATDMGNSTAAGAPTALSNMTYDENNRYFKYNWMCMYQVISNANVLLQNVDGVDMEEEDKELTKAQAKFLRALAYRDLTDAWGPVPFLTELIDPTTAKDMELTSVADIEEYIIADLKECIDILPESWSGTDLARATKGAAATLLGKIYLREHDYSNAKTYFQMVLDLETSGVYELESDFKNVWSESNKQSKEFIFYILHEATTNGGEIANHFGPYNHPEVANRWQYYAVSLPFWRKYSDDDPRKEFFYYDYWGSDDIFYEMPEEGQSEPSDEYSNLLTNVATMKYSYEMVSESYYDGRTISVFRLSDVILCMAEVQNNLSGPTAALPYLNRIRARAGAPEYTSSELSSVDEMNQAILDERGFELVFEFQRRADLLRFDKYDDTVNEYLQQLNLTSPTTVEERLHYFPYPLDEAEQNCYMEEANETRVP